MKPQIHINSMLTRGLSPCEHGKKSDGNYGKIDNLRLYYNCMQVDSVKEDALPVTYAGAFCSHGVCPPVSTSGRRPCSTDKARRLRPEKNAYSMEEYMKILLSAKL